MAFDYDKLYGESPDALGAPSPVFVDFFDRFERRGARVLDVGCGQGRDALFIARRGHSVVGVDIAPNGIRDLLAAAQAEALPVVGDVADLADYAPEGLFDVVLIDRTLHMMPPPARHAVLARLLDHVDAGGWLLIADERSNMAGLRAVIAGHAAGWTAHLSRGGTLFLQRG
ncbi:hypothetical protein OG2516_14678 [Oceanicola granulosus HTCC2516]|uniref:Methyltransferase domain-containing protein n=1 Tax=Oceanicola granulosus (strain ATCC BAA-861 / DSM 15982 / KCTC 12143 / HTCC2516) TaxID=314256 RepID=Q2CC80_OCEGH|nr:class I SAM-dependent methyltransferase [Oceanicola granulosus]EAR50280.1 hypothetical protein OG2516_14678 [Oceanicola granulosus HTCC2516]